MPNVLGAFGTVRNFMSIVKEVDFDEVRGRAETPPAILVCAPNSERASSVIASVFGDGMDRFVDVRTDWFEDVDGSRYDIVAVVDPDATGLLKKVRDVVGQDASCKVVSIRASTREMAPKEVAAAQDAIVGLNPDLAPALGRKFPSLQLAAVRAIVEETSKVNAQFALMSNIPAVVPIVGGIMAAGADFIVLTKNQVMMVFKIAAVHDRDLGNQFKLLRELAPVVGTGFVWRTVAREAVSFLPLAAGTIPKVAIAYVGTMVMGRAADYFYRFGQKPTKEQLKAFTEKATESVSRLQIGKKDEQGAAEETGGRPVAIEAEETPKSA